MSDKVHVTPIEHRAKWAQERTEHDEPEPLTADTITDEQIRELLTDRHNPLFDGKLYQIKYACEVALQREPQPTSAHRWRYDNARQICADAWNLRARCAEILNARRR